MEKQSQNHSTQRKKWNEYFIDFIMLFVAVTLGFYAENVRDQQTEKNREISYLKNVHEDLLVDIDRFERVISNNNYRLHIYDSLHMEMNKTNPGLPSLYFYIRNLALRTTFESSHLGLDQIKSSGGFRLIQNAKIISGIQDYEVLLNGTMKLEEVRERSLEQLRFKMAIIFDANTLYQMTKNQDLLIGNNNPLTRFKRPTNAAPFVVGDRENLNELINLVNMGLNTNLYLNIRYNELIAIAKDLDAAITAEYGNQFVDK